MQQFMDEHFLLNTATARQLYHEYAAELPIIDYHCHLDPEQVATNHKFRSITELWLSCDHLKWRAMRANGVAERFVTGSDTSDWEKFEKWAQTMPYLYRNPLYHWAHLELRTAFGITEQLSPSTARAIYDACNEQLAQPQFSAQGLMQRYKVETVCTTDDPVDDLRHHEALRQSGATVSMLPTWRPDRAMNIEKPDFADYMALLSEAAKVEVHSFASMVEALQLRHDYFHAQGCRLSDHGLEEFYNDPYTPSQIETIFEKAMRRQRLSRGEVRQYKHAFLRVCGQMDHATDWAQQFHYGALRDCNTALYHQLGPDTGFDSIGEYPTATAMSHFLNELQADGTLTRTILYCLNPSVSEVIVTMMGNFQEGDVAGKMQFGAGWWYTDSLDGMTRQLNVLSSLGLLSRFVGKHTDSRSFLSYPRHEYFRRLLCRLLGEDVKQGLLPADPAPLQRMVQDICYHNARRFFRF